MTAEQVGGIVRAVAGAVLGYLAGKGMIGSEEVAGLVAALGTIAIAVWSWKTNKPA